MKKNLILLLGLILLMPSFAFSGIVTFKIGYFIPQAKSDLWAEEFNNMSFSENSFHNTYFGFSYEYFFTREISFALTIDGYSKNKSGYYNGYVGYQDVDETLWAYPDDYVGDFTPSHSFNISITPVQFSLKLTPLGRRNKIIPYVGGGVGIYLWNVRLRGDLIDFSDEWYDIVEEVTIYPIYSTDTRENNRISVGWHAFAGFMFPVARRMTFEVEFKYNSAKGKFPEDDPNQGFHGFEPFDLSGYQISLGLNYWF